MNNNTKGGIRGHKLYSAWAGMLNRCRNPNNKYYAIYGGRGITVCDRWLDFRAFLEDMGERPEGCTLDRIDPDGPYAPDNCRWADAARQRANWSATGKARQAEAASKAAKQRWDAWRAERPPAEPKGPRLFTCRVCGCSFQHERRGQIPFYCGAECRKAAHKERAKSGGAANSLDMDLSPAG